MSVLSIALAILTNSVCNFFQTEQIMMVGWHVAEDKVTRSLQNGGFERNRDFATVSELPSPTSIDPVLFNELFQIFRLNVRLIGSALNWLHIADKGTLT